jgi:hypothetical protein
MGPQKAVGLGDVHPGQQMRVGRRVRPAAAAMKPRRPKPFPETNRQGRTRYLWRFERLRYWTEFYDDPAEARADATTQITQQINGSWQERSGRRMLLED